MTMDGAMDLEAGQMLTYLHFTPGDIVLFYGWVPSSKGAMVGTCIGLFLFALVERWIAACRGVMEAHWRKRWVQRFFVDCVLHISVCHRDSPFIIAVGTGTDLSL